MTVERGSELTRPHPDRHYYDALIPRHVRAKLGLGFAGSVLVSLVETGSILVLLPLIQILSGSPYDEGTIGTVWRWLGQPPRDALLGILLGFVVAGFVLKDAFTIWFRWWMLGFTAEQQVQTSSRIFSYLLHAPFSVHLRRGTSDMMRSVGDATSIFWGRIVGGALGAATEALAITMIVVALLLVMPIQTLAVIAYFGVAGLVFLRIIKPRVEMAGQRQLEAGRETLEWVLWGFGGIKETQLRHSQDHFVDGYRTWARRGAAAGREASFLGELPKYLLEILFIVGLAILVIAVAASGRSEQLLGTLGLLAAAAFRVLPSLTRLLASITTVRSGARARDLLFDELAREEQMEYEEAGALVGRLPFEHELRLDDVSFHYDDSDLLVLDKVSVTIPRGKSVAIVGGSGAGKTTLANLILGLLRPTSGKLLADGVDISTSMARWQNNLAIVPQEVYLMDTTLAQNIAYDEPLASIDRSRLQRAVEQAQLIDLVSGVFGGLDATFGERGARLSGGQKQRIGIARALYRSPALLLLDEATSALDNETERRITDTIHALHGEITIVIIAHRLSTVKDVDTILLMDAGRIVDQGTFSELVQRNQEFAHLVELGSLTSSTDG